MSMGKRHEPKEVEGSKTILLIDDDLDDVSLIEEAMLNAGIALPVIHVQDGEQAMYYLEAKPPYDDRTRFPLPTLVLLDLKMPRRSGFDVLSWIKTQPQLEDVAVIVLTGSDREEDRRRAQELGAWDFQVKPVNFSDLVQIARGLEDRWISGGPPLRSAPQD